MTENLVTIAVAVLASNWFGAVLKDIIDSRSKKRKPTDEMLLALVRRQLLGDAKHYIEKGFIPEDEYEAFSMLFGVYINRGGNSTVKRICEEALKLPIR